MDLSLRVEPLFLLIAVVIGLYSDDLGAAPRSASADNGVPWRCGVDLTADSDGGLSQRVIADIDRVRAVWWLDGEMVLLDERPGPAGTVEERYSPRNPLVDPDHRVGFRGGPIVFGPLRPSGAYKRAFDPTSGGVGSTPISQTDRLVLDSGLEPTSWSGVGLVLERGDSVRHQFGIGGGYVVDPDRGEVLITHLHIAPWRGRFGGITTVAARSIALDEGHPVTFAAHEESWLVPIAPVRFSETARLGVGYRLRRGGYSDPTGAVPIPIDLLCEGWRERASYRPARSAWLASCTVGGRKLRLVGRTSFAETGFLDIEATAPRRASYGGVRLQGRLYPPHRWRSLSERGWYLEGLGDWEREQLWEDRLREPARYTQRYLSRIRSQTVVSLLSVEWTVPDRVAEVHGEIHPISSDPGRVDLTLFASQTFPIGEDAPTPRGGLRATFRNGRGRKIALQWRASPEKGEGGLLWSHSGTLSLPFGETVELLGSIDAERIGTEEEAIEGFVRIRFYRAAVTKARG